LLLIAAILRQAVADAKSTARSQRHGYRDGEAVEWLKSSPDLEIFADMLDIKVSYLREQLLIEAGLLDKKPRLGERREPLPRDHRSTAPSTYMPKKSKHLHAVAALMAKGMNRPEMVRALGVTDSTVRNCMRMIRKQEQEQEVLV
jgi:hypothetical protein